MSYGKPPKDKQFKPGQSGNPQGRPPGTGLGDRLRKLLNENPDRAQAIIDAGVKAAEEGDFRFWNAIFEHLEGKPAQQTNMNITGEIHIAKVVLEDLKSE